MEINQIEELIKEEKKLKSKVKVNINMDPINDGVFFNDSEERESERDVSGMILATNNSYKLLNNQEATDLLVQFGAINVSYFVLDEFACIYNNDKVFEVGGQSFLAGSVFVLRESDDVFNLGQLDEVDIQNILSGIGDRMVNLVNGDHTFSAIML